MENQPEQAPKRNSNVIYFLIVVVVALLGTDVYLYLQKNKSDVTLGQTIVSQRDEKSRLNTELDSLQAQVEQVNASKTKMSTAMQAKNDSLQSRIKVLRVELAKGTLTKEELVEAQENVKQLRYFVAKYTTDIDSLQKQNVSLKTERDTIKRNLAAVRTQADTLTRQNKDLNNKVVIASALKVGQVGVAAYKIKSSGKEVEVTRSSPAKKLKISFTVASNTIAEKGLHTIYIRIMDPTGNQVTQTDSGPFSSDGQDMQFTYKTSIDFKDDGSPYVIDWINPSPFTKGTYTVMLYADGYTMGKSSVTLK